MRTNRDNAGPLVRGPHFCAPFSSLANINLSWRVLFPFVSTLFGTFVEHLFWHFFFGQFSSSTCIRHPFLSAWHLFIFYTIFGTFWGVYRIGPLSVTFYVGTFPCLGNFYVHVVGQLFFACIIAPCWARFGAAFVGYLIGPCVMHIPGHPVLVGGRERRETHTICGSAETRRTPFVHACPRVLG